jgi:glucosamine-6-phosphate deaminase
MDIHIYKEEVELDGAASDLIADLLKCKPQAVLGLATGGTPVGMYKQLVDKFRQQNISFSQCTTFNLDEYVGISSCHPESYYQFMCTHLFDHIDLPKDRAYLPNGEAKDLQTEIERYDKLLMTQGPIDLQVLGLGHNGHIGFNEPGDQLMSRTHVVKLNNLTRQANARFFPSLDDVPTHAITMGVGSILKVKRIVLLVKGAEKADIVKRALTGPITTDIPASLLQTHPHLTVLLDTEAAEHLHLTEQN